MRWLPLYSLVRPWAEEAPAPESPYSEVEPLYPESKQLAANEHPFDVKFAYRRYSMLIEPAIYLEALTRDFLLNGGHIVIREFQSREELMGLRENLLFNCTGLGAGKLFGDAEVTPIRGQLTFLMPQAEVDYMTVGPGGYLYVPAGMMGSCWAGVMSVACRVWRWILRRPSGFCGRTGSCLGGCGGNSGRAKPILEGLGGWECNFGRAKPIWGWGRGLEWGKCNSGRTKPILGCWGGSIEANCMKGLATDEHG